MRAFAREDGEIYARRAARGATRLRTGKTGKTGLEPWSMHGPISFFGGRNRPKVHVVKNVEVRVNYAIRSSGPVTPSPPARDRYGVGGVLLPARRSGDPPDPRTQNQCILKFNISSTMEGLDAALASLRLLKSINYAETAREYKCDETTLRRRH